MIASLALTLLCAPPGALADRVVAVVDKEVLTESELLAEARIALAVREGGDAASQALAPELVEALRDYVVNQVLVASHARRVGAADVSDHEVQTRKHLLTRRFRSQTAFKAFLRRFGISEGAVNAIMRRDLRNQRYIDQQMRSRLLTVVPDQSDYRARYDEAFRSWLTELRDSADIRLLGPGGQLEAHDKP